MNKLNDKNLKNADPKNDETIAEYITKISDGFLALTKTGLNKHAIVILIQAETGISKTAIRSVIETLPRLKEIYLVKK